MIGITLIASERNFDRSLQKNKKKLTASSIYITLLLQIEHNIFAYTYNTKAKKSQEKESYKRIMKLRNSLNYQCLLFLVLYLQEKRSKEMA
jgi:hypothetical protein